MTHHKDYNRLKLLNMQKHKGKLKLLLLPHKELPLHHLIAKLRSKLMRVQLSLRKVSPQDTSLWLWNTLAALVMKLSKPFVRTMMT